MDVLIVNFPETLIAVLEHHGPEPQIYQTVQRFIEWRKANGIGPDKGDTYSLHYSDPLSTLPEDYRQDIAVTVDAPVAPNPQGVITKIIPAGRCAMLRYKGSREYIPAADYLYAQWLPDSGEELRDFPFFFHYVNVGPDIRDANMLTDLYLPIK
jgi:AraC family transcriptional regulator